MKKLDIATVNKRMAVLGTNINKLLKEYFSTPEFYCFEETVETLPFHDSVVVKPVTWDLSNLFINFINEKIGGSMDSHSESYFVKLYHSNLNDIIEKGPTEANTARMDYPVSLRYWDSQGNVEYIEVEG